MTGYGRGVAEKGGRRAEVEIRSVNHRFMDIKLRGAPLDTTVEEKVTARVRDRITRGALSVTIRVEGAGAAPTLRVDREAARRVHAELEALAAELAIAGPISLELLCSQPGVLVPVEGDRSSDALADCACEAVDAALDQLIAMRDAEGEALARDLEKRMARLGAIAGELEREAAAAPAEAQKRLRDRLARLLSSGQVAVDEGRLAQEVAILADRMDVTEELVRVRSHLAQVSELMAQRAPAVGRRLDFLVQELGREVNTIASKSQSSDIARLVVEAKAELEKVREQVQNIE
ncbi:MAG TPA: YicC/YloC family endoribonuclease [Kofleriaceae bacterium]|nr:YicC/YloC family endoribonuclease [Kofleriaceae bacterium]